MRRIALIALPLIALVAITRPNFADDKKDAPKGDQPKMTPEMQKMMEECMKLATPGEHHKAINPMAGKWTYTSKMRMSPSEKWSDGTGEASIEWVLGGRFLSQKATGKMPEMPGTFEGMGMLGYDNQKQKYVSTWADNMGTMLMYAEGKGTGKDITFNSTMWCPFTKKDVAIRFTYKIDSDDRFTMEWFSPDPATGKEFQSMVLSYTRSKM